MKLLIYVPLISPRIKYIFGFIFNDILRTEIDFTINKEEFLQSNLPKMSYSEQPIGNELFFKSKHLLFEHKILAQQIRTTDFGEMKVPFSVSKSTLPFDVFTASFYFLSRYEEYMHHEKKNSESYTFKDSLQYQLKLLKIPIIDNWALILKNILLKRFPDLTFGIKQFSFKAMFINHLQKKQKKNFIINTTTYIKAVISNRLHSKKDKIKAVKQIINHNNGFSHMLSDNDISLNNNQHLIAQSQIPKSYIKLIKHTVTSDYSMFYPDFSGFRAGTCTSFYWYDLQLEKKTRLLLHPVAATDLNLLKNKTPEALLLQMNEIVSSAKLVNGDLYFLSLSNDIQPQ